MERSIDLHLKAWFTSKRRKAMLLRGARQVGKTWSVRELGKQAKYFCELNFEEDKDLARFFSGSLAPEKIVEKLSAYKNCPIRAGETLLFFDEVQACPDALRSLRFFYEKIPNLHIIAAGSLLEFALSEMPSFGVGRIQSLFMYPLSFREFLQAHEETIMIDYIGKLNRYDPIDHPLFEKLKEYYRTYLLIGGFPEVVESHIQNHDLLECMNILDDLILSFRDDFSKYKKHVPLLRLNETFQATATLAGGKFKFSNVNPHLPSYQIKDALELLVLAGLAHKIYHTSAQGIPLGSQVNEKKFKVIPCDVGLYQRLLGLELAEELIASDNDIINKGQSSEVVTGTELLVYSSAKNNAPLYYWHRESRGSNAEVDYLIEFEGDIIPLEVKTGDRGKMQSLRVFMSTHDTPYGIRMSLENAGEYDDIKVVPACTIFRLFN